ncbi:hypothetical protein M5D96_014159 [Drosophila gunungcola]|uniref:Uncharacterized protein n=1 Tax=Drosophila gunungcola TaxID=103775 RepID=A0A9P9Y9X2_9MUSC|nr:hypothetical protein M5D96_014159 [Drosophila gunungcola]
MSIERFLFQVDRMKALYGYTDSENFTVYLLNLPASIGKCSKTKQTIILLATTL